MQPLSVEEVLRQHREAQQRRPREQETSLRRLKAEHLKARGDEAIKAGNYREAWDRYGEALELQSDRAALPALHSNRSLAYCKGGRYVEALADADEAARLAPRWHKAHWRRATALLALRRTPEAVLACREAWRLASSSGSNSSSSDSKSSGGGSGISGRDRDECAARLWAAVQKLTREQLAAGMLSVLGERQAAGQLQPPLEEEAVEQELVEAMFRLIKAAHGRRKMGPYYHRYLRWLQQGVQPGEAYTERAAVHAEAKCYLQARADAQAAVATLLAQQREQQEQQQAQPPTGRRGGSSDHQRQQGQGQGQVQPDHEQQGPSLPGQETGQGGGLDLGAPLAVRSQLALAYRWLGQAFLAQKDHPDRDPRGAAKAFLRAAELDSRLEGLQEQLQEASGELTLEQMNQVEMEVYNEGPADGSGGGSSGGAGGDPLEDGPSSGRLAPGQRLFRVALRLAFPAARAADCSYRARELLRSGVATAAGVDSRAVTIERVAAPTAARPHLQVLMHVKVGTDLLRASRLAKAVGGAQPERQAQQGGEAQQGQDRASEWQQAETLEQQQGHSEQQCGGQRQEQQQQQRRPEEQLSPHAEGGPAADQLQEQRGQREQQAQQEHEHKLLRLVEALGGEAVTALLGQPDAALCSAEIEDVTPACAGASEAEQAEQDAINRGEAQVAPEKDRRLALPSRPKMELELPYRMYRLVRADGTAVERVDKHPFCMSRVYYDATEKPEEVWTELADGSCRWRQTGGEVKVLALKVPRDLPTRQLGVEIEPYSIKVWNRVSGEVYLEGGLERGVVPEDCFWTHCGGEGEDGCALYLRKMNLELLQKHWMHSEMWWPRLLKCHTKIAWDDYEKDYSDLPEEVLQRHRVVEAIKGDERRLETVEREHREALQERDDLRKRTRQERLNELRTGTQQSWVLLNRALPAC